MMNKQILLALMASTVTAACGGSPKSGVTGGGKGVPPPPSNVTSENTPPGKEAPKREISKDARNDYQGAAEFFASNEKGGTWNESSCKSAADKFGSVARQHPELVEAQYMVGLSYHRCNLAADAERAYQAALKIKPNHGASLSNLGELYYRAGKIDGARGYWDSAIKANGKLVAARINVASMELDQMRKIDNPKDANWKKLEEDARFNLSNVLGVDSDNVKAYALYGLIYMEGWQTNKNRLDLAKTLLDEGKKRNEKSAVLQNAYGLYFMHRAAINEALQHFTAAVAADPKFVEAHVNVGLTTLGFRKYDTAKDELGKALELQPKNYEAMVGLGIAQRGLKDLDGAEATYKKAKDIDPKRGDAFYNLGVLWKDFKANKQEDLKASQQAYRTAKDFFQQAVDKQLNPTDKEEAKAQIALCDKTVAQLDSAMKAAAAAPPAAPPAPPAPPAGK
jgi:Tfp pilus assembly protein PilF